MHCVCLGILDQLSSQKMFLKCVDFGKIKGNDKNYIYKSSVVFKVFTICHPKIAMFNYSIVFGDYSYSVSS